MYRHQSGMGTVVISQMAFSTIPKSGAKNTYPKIGILVLDAKYRSFQQWATSAALPSGIHLNNYVSWQEQQDIYIGSTDWLTPCNSTTRKAAYGSHTDGWIATLDDCAKDPNNAKFNGDKWMTLSGSTAIHYARGIKVGGVGCDVPVFQELIMIFNDAEFIDNMDPTVKSYPQYALFTWGQNKNAWSSTHYYSYYMDIISYNGRISNDYGGSSAGYITYSNLVIPIQELSSY